MDAAPVNRREQAASDPLISRLVVLEQERRSPAALVRLEALIGPELAHRLLRALVSSLDTLARRSAASEGRVAPRRGAARRGRSPQR